MNCLDTGRISVCGVPVDTSDHETINSWIQNILRGHEKRKTIFSINPEKVMLLRNNRLLTEFIEGSDLLLPDGTGIIWAAKRLYGINIRRISGIDLMDDICKIAESGSNKIYILGSKEISNRLAVAALKKRYPLIDIVGRHHGYFKEKDTPQISKSINDSGADILFVGLGSPAQEIWITENLTQLNVKLCMGIGGALDVLSGIVRRAPKIIRKMGLEWLFRLIQQPGRIRRQIALVSYVCLVRRYNKYQIDKPS